MKNYLRTIFTLGAFCVVFGCATAAFGQMVGGYRSAAVDDPQVVKAANFAVKAKAADLPENAALESVLKAETQVVQGTNYRLCLEIYVPSEEAETDGVMFYYQTIVYRDLKNNYRVGKFEESECGGE